MYNSKPAEGDLPTSRQLGRTTAIAAGIAIILLVGVVMPSEYGIDPTGVGRVLGLKEMGEIKEQLAEEAAADAAMDAKAAEDEAAALLTQVSTQNRKTVEVAQKPAASNAATAAEWRDEEQVVLTPGQGTEIKLVMKAGERASYQWSVEGGVVNFDNTKGTDIRLDQGSVLTDYEFAPGWKLTNGMRYRDSYTVRNGVYPTSVATAASFLASNRAALLAAFPGATDVQIRYADNGQAFNVASQNGNGDIFINAARPVTVWEREFLNDFRIAHKFEAAGTHDLAFGFYYANIDETFSRYSASTVQDVSNNSRLLDVVAVNAAGSVVGSLTKNGVARYGSEFANGTGSQTTIALYASDEWQITPTLRFDGGIRWEQMKATGAQEGQKTVNLGDPTTLADDNVLTGSGVFTNFDRKFDSIGYTAGLDWQFARIGGVFARYTHAFRMPSVGSFITSATATPVIQGIDMWEGGIKLSTPLISVYATGFLTDYDSYSIGNFVFAPPPATGVIQQTVYTDTRAYGVELEATLRPVKWFDFTVQATIQEPTFRNLRYNENTSGGLVARNYSGNQLLRVPKLSLRATPAVTLFDGRLRAQMDVEHYGDRYADAANTSKLPAYTVINASVSLGLTKNIRLWAYGDNLTNTIGLTEGNPRAGELTSGQANDLLFIGRPIVGRNIRFAVDFSF